MTESIEIRNYSNVKGFLSCYANVGPFVFELIALHRKETVAVLSYFISLLRSMLETKQQKKHTIKKYGLCIYLLFQCSYILWIALHFVPKHTHGFIDFTLQDTGI